MDENSDLTGHDAVALLEQMFQRQLPSDFVAWLLAPNAPYPAPANVRIPDESPWIARIELFYAAQQILQMMQEEAASTQRCLSPSFPNRMIPIGESYGDYYLLSLREGDYGSVLFMFHETANARNEFRGLITLSGSFAAWLPTLESLPEDEEVV